tara:strand:- start:554 stop:817 length:264 start_codon:yes stop_codon:yes gene_type:complete
MTSQANEAPTISAPPERLLTIQEVISITNISRSTLYELVKHDGFPRQVIIKNPVTHKRLHNALWRRSDVEQWIKDLPLNDKNDNQAA